MALLHHATIDPGKLDLLVAWLPSRPWASGGPPFERLDAYRFDDPAGEVGLEVMLLRAADGAVLHVPLTYRGQPLAGAEEHLVGTTEHSVLGTRWVYDGCGDPVWVTAALTAVLTGGTEAEQYFEDDGRREVREPTVTVRGSGAPGTDVSVATVGPPRDAGPATVVRVDDQELVVVRVVGAEVTAGHTLTGSWPGQDPTPLVGVRRP